MDSMMDVIRDIRTDYKDFLARLFIDFLLLWMRFFDRIYRMKNGSATTATGKRETDASDLQDTSRQRKEDSKGEANEQWTEADANKRNSRRNDSTEPKELGSSHLRGTEEMHWSRNGGHSSGYSESLEEVDSSILESSDDLQRQISALSDYYSDDEYLESKWTTAKRDETIIAESLAIAENLERRSSDFRQASSTYKSFCEGLDKLKVNFTEILEKWKKHNDQSMSDLGGFASVEEHRRRNDSWNRSVEEATDWRGSDLSALNGSPERSSSRLSESLRQRKSSLEQNRQMLDNYEQLMQQRSAQNHRMFREYNETKELLTLMEKKKIELCAKVNNQEWKGLSDSCEVLYEQQPQLREHCKRLTRDMVDRRKDVQDGVEIIRAAVEGLDTCLSDESARLKTWLGKKSSTFNQIEQAAHKLKRQFDERKMAVSELECNSYITKFTDCLNLHLSSSAQLLEDWNAVSLQAQGILKKKYLDLDEQEERCSEWNEFSEVDEFREEYKQHLDAFRDYVPRICQIHEQRSPGATGIFGIKAESVEFNKFYLNYKRKMKAIGENYSDLERARMRCCKDIEKYRELYDVVLGLTEKQRQIDKVLREEELSIRMTHEMLKEYRDSVHSHLISNQGKRLLVEKQQIVEALKRIEKQLDESSQTIELFENDLTATSVIIEEIDKGKVLLRHFGELKTLAADWEKHKSYEKIFNLIIQIENFRAAESPHRLIFEAHEERVSFLERRLPQIVKLHQENYSTYLDKWLAYSLEYNESEKEPLSVDKISKLYETWSLDCERISQDLDSLKKEFIGCLQQLHRLDEALALLSAQGCSIHGSESPNCSTDRLDEHFRRVEAACHNFKQELTNFRPLYGPYLELKTGHHQVMTKLTKEQYSSGKLTERLKNCEGLLREHRDHLERRRIKIKIDELLASIKEALIVKVEECENQVKRLEGESERLIHNFVGLSGRHYSEISHLQVPNLREVVISLDDFQQNLNASEEKLGTCEGTLIREEKAVHEYYDSVRLTSSLLSQTNEKMKIFESKLEAGEKLLSVCKSFIESYTNLERSFDSHLSDSKLRLDAFKDVFNSIENEANKLDQLFRLYCSHFAGDASTDSFRTKCFAQLSEITTTMEGHRKRLRAGEHGIRTNENETRKQLEEGRRNKEGIMHGLTLLSKDISAQKELMKKCKSLFADILEKKTERESKSDALKKRLQAENYEEHCKVYQPNPMENEDSFICKLCSKDTRPHDGIILRECRHKFCKKCLEVHIKHSKTAVVACPRSRDSTSCFGIVLDKEIQTFGEDVNKLCADRSLSEYREQNKFVLTCGSCNRLIADDDQPRCQKPFFKCPYCEKKNCRRCKVVHEDRETCEDYQLTLPYRKILESLKCKICLEKDVQVAFIPCGHVICCAECAVKLKEMAPDRSPAVCPCCRKPVQKPIKIYLQTDALKPDDSLRVLKRK